MILSDRTIREELTAGRIVIDPFDETAIQPSSVDLRLGRFFRVFLNHTTRVIDVKENQENLTPLVEIGEDDSFILHPGEFVLGSTLERVALPTDLVARLEGKSSLGRLGLLIHSSLPAGERVMVLHEGRLELRPIDEIVLKQLHGQVVSFDPDTFEVGFHDITGWYEGPADRIYEVVLRSGRSVRVTAGHNLFTLGRDGDLRKVRTGELKPGTRVAIPRVIPDPGGERPRLDLLALAPETAYSELVVEGPSVARVFETASDSVRDALLAFGPGVKHASFYRRRARLPLTAAFYVRGLLGRLTSDDFIAVKGSSARLPVFVEVDDELAWLLGLYVAEGCRRRGQVTISNTDQSILDRAERALGNLGVSVYRSAGAITACSTIFSHLIDWLDAGTSAVEKRIPSVVFGWPKPLVASFLEGFVDGDGSREVTRTSLWSSSSRLVDDFLYLAPRLGLRASASLRRDRRLFQVSIPRREHKLLTAVPLPDELLVRLRREAGLNQCSASRAAGYRYASDLNNIEKRSGRDAVRFATLRRLRDVYANTPSRAALDRLVDGHLLWDEVVEVRDTGKSEPIYDLEIRPDGRHIENFLAGTGGVFVSNTAGFVDAGWDGHLTLELSNVANLPITLYPGMKIGQISFLKMTTPADRPYGSKETGSKYQGQRGPTPSRYFENFRE